VDVYAQDLCIATRYFPGIEALLAKLDSADKAWGVVTNKPAGLTEPLLEQLGIAARCAAIVSGDTLTQRKPHPAPLLHALELSGHSAAAAVYVGDAPQDIAAGNAAGMTTIAVAWGYIIPGQNPADWGADYTVEEPGQIPAL
jgi:phosphoglycolate phosphatase